MARCGFSHEGWRYDARTIGAAGRRSRPGHAAVTRRSRPGDPAVSRRSRRGLGPEAVHAAPAAVPWGLRAQSEAPAGTLQYADRRLGAVQAHLRGVPPARGPEGEFPGGAGDRYYRGAGLGRDPDPALARVGGDVVADQFHSDRGLAQDEPGHSQPPPQGLRQFRGDLPLRPARAAAPDVLVMHEELDEVGPLIHARQPE